MFGRFFGSRGDGETPSDTTNKGKIESFEYLTLRESGMRFIREYELTSEGEKTRVERYAFNYSTGEEERILEKSVTIDTADVVDKLNEVKFYKWNGFSGDLGD